MAAMNFKPLRNIVVILELGEVERKAPPTPVPQPIDTAPSAEAPENRYKYGKVVAAGPDTKGIKEGDTVIYERYYVQPLVIGGEEYTVLYDYDILLVV